MPGPEGMCGTTGADFVGHDEDFECYPERDKEPS